MFGQKIEAKGKVEILKIDNVDLKGLAKGLKTHNLDITAFLRVAKPLKNHREEKQSKTRRHGKPIGEQSSPLPKPTHQAPNAHQLHQHHRVRSQDHPIRLQDRNQARPRVPLRLRGRQGPNPKHGRQEEEARRPIDREARLQEGLRHPQIPTLAEPGALPNSSYRAGEEADDGEEVQVQRRRGR